MDENTLNCGVPLKHIRLKPGVLIAGIVHGTKSEVPNGESSFVPGDRVVAVTSHRGSLQQLGDIFA